MDVHAKLPVWLNKSAREKNLVAEVWGNLNGEKGRFYSLSTQSLSIPVGITESVLYRLQKK